MSSKSASSGVSLSTVLVLIFLVLKLTGNIAWSWWWVFSPYWIALLVVVGLLAVGGVCLGIASIVDKVGRDRRLDRLAREADEARRR